MSSTAVDPLDQMVADYSLVTNGYSGTAPNTPYPMLAEKRGRCPVMHGDLLLQSIIAGPDPASDHIALAKIEPILDRKPRMAS